MEFSNPVLLCNQCGKEMAADRDSFPTLGGNGVIVYNCKCGHRKLVNIMQLTVAEIAEMNEDVRRRF